MVAEGLGSLNVNAAKPPAPAASTANAGLEAAGAGAVSYTHLTLPTIPLV